MTLGILGAATFAYWLLLFLVAYLAERGRMPARLRHHPLVYALSLGVYASTWTYYGSVGFARHEGFSFLTVYLGPTLACLAIPVIWLPILRLTREHQLTSLADLFAFRYRSQLAGVLVTFVMLAGSVPYLALQFRALLESMRVLSGQSPLWLGIGFTLVLTLFAVLFGARGASPRERHDGLLFVVALESLVKLAALLAVGAVAYFGVLGGPRGLGDYFRQQPDAVASLYRPVREGPWGTYLLLSFSAAFLLPRQFHVAFAEHVEDRALFSARVTFPLYLLMLNLAVVPVLWAGTRLHPGGSADFYVLDVSRASGSSLLTILAFIGGISSGSAMVIVTAIALASMCMNHLLLPAGLRLRERNLYQTLAWMRRVLIALVVFAGYGFYRLALHRTRPLVDFGLISFVTVAQCLPGLLGVLFWRRATGLGLSLGLFAGFAVWFAALAAPLFGAPDSAHWWSLVGGNEPFFPATFLSLAVNGLLFVGASLLRQPSAEEREAARVCCDEPGSASRPVGPIASPDELRARLALLLGEAAAERETSRALATLGMAATEKRPAELRRLRAGLERNLSALFGPLIARLVVEESQRVDPAAAPRLGDRLQSLEEQLRALPRPLEGTASELELFWRYLRDVLEDLPLGVCALAADGTVVIWNHALGAIAETASQAVRGCTLDRIGEPWGALFARFLATSERTEQATVVVGDERRALQLSKSRLSAGAQLGGWVLLVEDRTVARALEEQLIHQDRLASIGQLAAGLSHELGNPLTGITCVAQNLRDDLTDLETRERVQQILDLARRIDAIVRTLLSFSRAGAGQSAAATMSRVGVGDAVREAIALVHIVPRNRQIEMLNRCSDELTLDGDRQRLIQVLVNLLANACDASPPGGQVEVTSDQADGRVRIAVSDRGRGMTPNVRRRVFEPFFTTKDPGAGTGLGLSLVYNIVRDHGGEVALESVLGAGTVVTVELPAAKEPAAMSERTP
jgi:Na+/proline symporter/signal transduction histidine kinase